MKNNVYRHERVTANARAITDSKKAKARKQRIILITVAVVLTAVIASTVMVFAAANAQPQTTGAAPTPTTSAAQTAPVSHQTAPKATSSQPISRTESSSSASTSTVQPSSEQPAAQQSTQAEAPKATEAAKDRIDTINGERVYIDTKRTAPDKTGTPLHFYANGKTSYGFDWNYDADSSNFTLRCDYNFNQQQYDFQFYGVTPGTSHVTLYYNTDDTTKVPVNLTIVVDDALNVTMA